MRLPFTPPEKRNAEQQRVAKILEDGPRKASGGPFRPLLENPAVCERIQHLGEHLRYGGKLPGALRELAILVCARHWTAQYEWYAHERVGRQEGLGDAIMAELKAGKRPAGMSAAETLVHDFCTMLQRERNVSDDLLAQAQKRFGADGVIELIALSGYYCMMSMVLNVGDVPLPQGEIPMRPLP
jgi:4-carboxymuconolactone decarboxylase